MLPLLAIALGRTIFKIPLTARSLTALGLGGMTAAWLVGPLGLFPATALGVLALTAWTLVLRSRPNAR